MTATDTAHDALIEELSLTRQEHENGVVIYRNHLGERHRVHGPAVIYPGGICAWYQYGKLHRTDGAACILNGIRYWFLNGEEVSEEEFNRRIASGDYLEP